MRTQKGGQGFVSTVDTVDLEPTQCEEIINVVDGGCTWKCRSVGVPETKHNENFHTEGASGHRDLEPECGEKGMGAEEGVAAVVTHKGIN